MLDLLDHGGWRIFLLWVVFAGAGHYLFQTPFGAASLGAFLPLGFTDGNTLLRWLPGR